MSEVLALILSSRGKAEWRIMYERQEIRVRLFTSTHFYFVTMVLVSVTSRDLNIILQKYSSSNKCNVYSALLEISLLDGGI